MSITLPLGMFTFTSNQVLINGSTVSVSIVNNSTYQTISLLPNSNASIFNLTLAITNPSSTKPFGSLSVSTKRNGYSSQSASAVITSCLPMVLNVTSNTNSRYTGDTVNLTNNFTSNLNSKKVRITLPATAWSLTSASFLGSPLANNSLTQLNTTSNSFVFSNLINRIALFPLSESLVF